MSVWHKEGLTNQDAGKYFCTADNQAKLPLQSNVVNIKGKFSQKESQW